MSFFSGYIWTNENTLNYDIINNNFTNSSSVKMSRIEKDIGASTEEKACGKRTRDKKKIDLSATKQL